MAYHLEGRLLEVCDCRVLCPCWIGEDPDNGTCDTIVAYHFDQGVIDGLDVTNRTLAIVAHLPGNILKGNWRVAVYIDDKASDQQMDALLKVYTGKLGGPIADIAKLVGEVVAVERVPIRFDVDKGRGTIKMPSSSPILGRPARLPRSPTRSSPRCRAPPCSSENRLATSQSNRRLESTSI
jgi:hypothetical protein